MRTVMLPTMPSSSHCSGCASSWAAGKCSYIRGRLTLDARLCWVDAFAFEQLTDEDGQELDQLEKALALYCGAFLVRDPDAYWAISMRERLHRRFVRAACSGHREAVMQWGQAIVGYERALEIDDIAEELYQRLMICHSRLGQPAEVMAVYHRCRDVLAATL